MQLRITVFLMFVLAVSTVSKGDDDAMQAAGRPVVIVHGAWGGSHHWKAVADDLTHNHGRIVRRVSLTSLGPRAHLASPKIDLNTHIQDVVNAIEFDGLDNVLLVAHSYGGVVASGVVDRISDRISHVLYLDAHLLSDGEAYLTHHPEMKARLIKRANEAGDGWQIPVDWTNHVRDVPHPACDVDPAIESAIVGVGRWDVLVVCRWSATRVGRSVSLPRSSKTSRLSNACVCLESQSPARAAR